MTCEECRAAFEGRSNRSYCSTYCKRRAKKTRERALRGLPPTNRRGPGMHGPAPRLQEPAVPKKEARQPALTFHPNSVLASIPFKERSAFRRWMDAKNRDAKEFEHQLHRSAF